jgi:hypothetical protein
MPWSRERRCQNLLRLLGVLPVRVWVVRYLLRVPGEVMRRVVRSKEAREAKRSTCGPETELRAREALVYRAARDQQSG